MLFGGITKSKEEIYSEKEEEKEEKQPLQFKANWYAKDVISIFQVLYLHRCSFSSIFDHKLV